MFFCCLCVCYFLGGEEKREASRGFQVASLAENAIETSPKEVMFLLSHPLRISHSQMFLFPVCKMQIMVILCKEL